jgi:hypothetical protein
MKATTSSADDRPGLARLRVEVEFHEQDVRLRETPLGVEVELAGARAVGEPGGPALPRAVISVALPPFHWPTSVDVEERSTARLTDEPTLVVPMQTPRAGVEEDDDDCDCCRRERPSFRRRADADLEPVPVPPYAPPDEGLYRRATEEPPPVARHATTHHVGLTPIATIELNPIRYASDGALELTTELAIEITSVDARDVPQEIRLDPDEQKRLGIQADRLVAMPPPTITSQVEAKRLIETARDTVVNPHAVSDYSPIFTRLEFPAEHLIITDNNTWDANAITAAGPASGDLVAEFWRLSSWKNARGVSSKVVTISDIVGGRYGDFRTGSRDLQEVLRRFIRWAREKWGVCWVLLGGDVEILPTRIVAARCRGDIGTAGDDPPKDNASFWTGSYLKMKVVSAGDWWNASTDNLLVRPDTGELIPYDSTGTAGFGWHFTTDDSYATPSATVTQYVRVNGPAATVNSTLQWLYHWNQIPTDFYYSSLYCYVVSFQTVDLYGMEVQFPFVWEPPHHWDVNGNGVYGQYYGSNDMDGVLYHADVSVGRAAVSSGDEAAAFVDKVIAYESFRDPDGNLLDPNWPRRVLFGSTDWGGPLAISQAWSWPSDNTYHHGTGDTFTLIKTADVQTGLDLIAEISDTDRRVMPYLFGGGSGRGWFYVWSDTDPTPSELTLVGWGPPITVAVPTNWVRVQGTAEELAPGRYFFDSPDQDGSMHDQEDLREQIAAELPGLDTVNRLYEDELDLTGAERVAAPVAHITYDGMTAALNAAPHIVSLSGHGNPSGCCGTDRWAAESLTNGWGAFVGYADSCLTNAFDESDSMSEALLDNGAGGAVAYVGNTRFSWIGDGDDFQRAFFHRLTTTQHIGLLNDSRIQLVNDTSFNLEYTRWIVYSLNLLGDPEMPVRRSRYHRFVVKYRSGIDRRIPFDVHVYEEHPPGPPIPVPEAVVHLAGEGFSQLATSNADGLARFDLSLAPIGDLALTVTRRGRDSGARLRQDHRPGLGHRACARDLERARSHARPPRAGRAGLGEGLVRRKGRRRVRADRGRGHRCVHLEAADLALRHRYRGRRHDRALQVRGLSAVPRRDRVPALAPRALRR